MAGSRSEEETSDSSPRADIKKSVCNCAGGLQALDNLHLNYTQGTEKVIEKDGKKDREKD